MLFTVSLCEFYRLLLYKFITYLYIISHLNDPLNQLLICAVPHKCLCVVFLPFSGVGWWVPWNGVCLSATTMPEASTGKTALPPALVSYRPSWQTVRVKRNKCNAMWISGNQGCVVSFGARVSNPSWHVGGEWAPLPPFVALHASEGLVDPLAAAASLDPGSGNLSAGYRASAGSVCRGRNQVTEIQVIQVNAIRLNICCLFFLQMWCIWTHVKYLTSDEMPENKKSQWTAKYLIWTIGFILWHNFCQHWPLHI